ncbi:hypothetical protein Tco_0706582 [Tanacetum coccineum]|uniref:Uncharacterized protein n=1 Tax=Tanacetum coccineum TaxID=301880 RepID=A0ABQ4Y9D3_9ASTR
MSKPRFTFQVDVSNNLSRPVTQHYLSKRRESVFAKPDHMVVSCESRDSSKNMPRFSLNDMVHNHYLDEARKKTQERDMNSKTNVIPSTRFQSIADGSKPKPWSTNHSTRSLPVSKSSCVTITVVPKADHSKSSSSFLDSKHFVYSTCHKCVFNVNHDACITKLLKEVNSHAKIQSHMTRCSNKPIDQKSHTQKPGRQIFTRHRFSLNKTSAVYEKTSPRSDLRWKPTGRIFKYVGLKWIPTWKLLDSCTSKDDSEPTHGSNVDIPNIHESKETLDLSADVIVMTSMIELESLFGHLFDEYFNGENQVISKSSAITTADASDKRQQQPDSTSSTSTLATTVTTDGNFDLSYALSWKPCQGDSLNLPDHRIATVDLVVSDVSGASRRGGCVVEGGMFTLCKTLQGEMGGKDSSEESANEIDDTDDSDMDLTDDEPKGDDATARYVVFMYNKSTKMPKSTYFSLTITNSSLGFIQNRLNETLVKELTDLMSNQVYIDAHITSAVHNPEGNPKVRRFLLGAFEAPFGTYVDVQATNLVLQEMFSNDVARYISSPSATITHKLPINPQPNSLQAKAKKLMQKAKKNIRKINFKKTVTQKFREYYHKLEALTNINVSEASEKVVQARVLTKIKKLLPTHIPTAIANYVRPYLNTSVLKSSFHKRLSRQNKSLVVHAQDNTPVIQPLDQEDEYIRTRLNPERYTKSGSAGTAKRRITWFDLLLKSDIDQNENHILRPLTVAIENKLKALIQKDKLTITDLEGAEL